MSVWSTAVPRRRLLLTTLVMLTTIPAVISSLGAPLVPALAIEHRVSLAGAQWVLTTTFVMGAVATPVLGRLAAGRQRRRVVLVGLAVVTIGALISALPLGFTALLVGRTMQGVALGLTPIAIATAREAVSREHSSGVVALLSVTTVVGAGLGYPLAGFIADVSGVRGAFYFGLVLCLVTFALTFVCLPDTARAGNDSLDWVGAIQMSIGIAGLLLAVSQGQIWGWFSAPTVLLSVGSALCLIWWIIRTSRSDDPMVDLRLARRKGVLGANLTAVVAGMGMYMILTLAVILVQTPTSTHWGLGRSITAAGFLLVPYSLCSALGAWPVLAASRRFNPNSILPLGCIMYALATAALAQAHNAMWQALMSMALAGLGSACTFSALPGLIVRYVSPEETGSAIAFNQVLRYLGFSIGATLSLLVLTLFSNSPGTVEEAGFTASLHTATVIMLFAAGLMWKLARRPGV